MKYFLIIIFFLLSINTHASIKSMYVAGGCFWCVEEVYEKVEGVLSVYSGYSGGHVENPTYQEVVLGNTGHIEAAEINYDSSLVNEEQLVKLLFLNIDPFDEGGQFCDRGYSYKSAFFTSDEKLKKIINDYILKIENNHNQKVQTLVLPFKNFYLAEDYHQDYYKKNPIRYNYYKYSCGREQRIKQLRINLR
jgi:peptide-methionine (S)-S-oxide reductase